MFQFRLAATAAIGAALLTAMPAAAVVKVATYSGTIADGYDQTGVFGSPDTDLTGLGYVATFTYDTMLGQRVTDGVNYDRIFGGSVFGSASPIVVSTITINGVTRSIAGAYEGEAYTDNLGSYTQHRAFDITDDGVTRVNHVLFFSVDLVGVPGSLKQNFGPSASTISSAFFTWRSIVNGTVVAEYAYADFDIDSVYSVSDPVSEVPEPASWALMIGGFGMVGAALRRRREMVAA